MWVVGAKWGQRFGRPTVMSITNHFENYLAVKAFDLPIVEREWFMANRDGHVAVADAGEDSELHERAVLSALVERAAIDGYDGIIVK